MPTVLVRWFALAFFAVSLPGSPAFAAGAAEQTAASSGCVSAEPASYPRATIANGVVKAVLYLPDAKTGYYRGSRFDWSGVVGCLAYKGHTYFGVWFPHYDPMLHDAITGPVEEFRSSNGDSAQNYDQAKPDESFVKIGVGVLRKIDNAPFAFATPYPLIDGGTWTVRKGPGSVSFKQVLKSPIGFAYDYTKTVSLDRHEPILILRHELKNTGTVTIDTQVYDHDFYMLDGVPTGPDMVVRFPFEPKAEKQLGNGARIEGRQIVYDRELEAGQTSASYLGGYSDDASSYNFVVENRKTGVGVEQTGDRPISRINFWSIRATICPEAYVHLKIAPGETAHWTIRYRFYAR
ncbi:MAG: hypothetical protein P4L40_11370 [Terracidiphilus sp.]|nr:hypothetical protein [Terracidiphilus sp.]